MTRRAALHPLRRGPRIPRAVLDRSPEAQQFWRRIHDRHPTFGVAVAADAKITAARRGERSTFESKLDLAIQVLRLAWVTESFFGQCCYRAKAHLQARGVPFLPRFFDHLAVRNGQISIGDPVTIEAGVFIPHGQVCIDGITSIGAGSVLSPFISIGLRAGDYRGPTIGTRASIGTGARVLGPWVIGDRATVGANAVVTADIPADAVAVGIPARVVG